MEIWNYRKSEQYRFGITKKLGFAQPLQRLYGSTELNISTVTVLDWSCLTPLAVDLLLVFHIVGG